MVVNNKFPKASTYISAISVVSAAPKILRDEVLEFESMVKAVVGAEVPMPTRSFVESRLSKSVPEESSKVKALIPPPFKTQV